MKKILVALCLLSIVIACTKEQVQNGDDSKMESDSSGQVLSSSQKSNPELSFKNELAIQANTLLDSTQWVINNQNPQHDKDMFFVDAKWQIISKEQFKDSMLSNNYGSVLMTGKDNEKASKLRLLSEKEKGPITKERLAYATVEYKKSFRYKYFNTECPDFSFTDLNGNEITRVELKGKIVVLNFWNIGCKGCIQEIPDLNELVDQYKGNNDIVFVAPSTDSQKALITYFQKQEFMKTHHELKYIVATINYFKKPDLIEGHPTHIIVNREGVMTFIYLGSVSTINLLIDQEIKKLLI